MIRPANHITQIKRDVKWAGSAFPQTLYTGLDQVQAGPDHSAKPMASEYFSFISLLFNFSTQPSLYWLGLVPSFGIALGQRHMVTR